MLPHSCTHRHRSTSTDSPPPEQHRTPVCPFRCTGGIGGCGSGEGQIVYLLTSHLLVFIGQCFTGQTPAFFSHPPPPSPVFLFLELLMLLLPTTPSLCRCPEYFSETPLIVQPPDENLLCAVEEEHALITYLQEKITPSEKIDFDFAFRSREILVSSAHLLALHFIKRPRFLFMRSVIVLSYFVETTRLYVRIGGDISDG